MFSIVCLLRKGKVFQSFEVRNFTDLMYYLVKVLLFLMEQARVISDNQNKRTPLNAMMSQQMEIRFAVMKFVLN